MSHYQFTTKNHLECTTDCETVEADNIREVIIKCMYAADVDPETIKQQVDADLESFEQDGDFEVWTAYNEELSYIIEKIG